MDGFSVGSLVGVIVGSAVVGTTVGKAVDGVAVGAFEGRHEGFGEVGLGVGNLEGEKVGSNDGA